MESRFTPEQVAQINDRALRLHAEALEQAQQEKKEKQERLNTEYSKKYQAMLTYWQERVSPDFLMLVIPFEDYAAHYRGEYERPHFFHVGYNGQAYHIAHYRNADETEFFQLYQGSNGNRQEFFSAEAAEAEVWSRIGQYLAATIATQALIKKSEALPDPVPPSLDAQISGTMSVIEDYLEESYNDYAEISSMHDGYGRMAQLLNQYLAAYKEDTLLTKDAMTALIAISVAACRTIIDLGAAGGLVKQ
jgi:hypothetical protein